MDAKDVKINEYKLPPPSDEQKLCIGDVERDCNLQLKAVAGSGKTTTILHIASLPKRGNKLLLTYNSRLKDECREKTFQLGILDMEVHSYHAFCHKYYQDCKDDYSLKTIVEKDIKPRRNPPKYQMLIIDEMQDMNQLYYDLTQKILRDFGSPNVQFVCIGDPMQSIFQFNLADPKFLVESDKYYESKKQWVRRSLSVSYRLTEWSAKFINKAILGTDLITAGNKTTKTSVTYMVCNPFGNHVAQIIQEHIREGYRPDDIFVLTPSLRSDSSPARRTENLLVTAKIPCYVPMGDTGKIDQDLIGGKVVFGTFHQVKGLERKVVVVFGMDASYFTYFAKESPKDECPNTIYVALTRAKEHLIMVHAHTNGFLPFVNQAAIVEHSVYIEYEPLRIAASIQSRKRNLTVTQMVRHKPIQIIEDALKLVKYDVVRKAEVEFDVNTKIETPTGFEDVSALYGCAVPAILTYERTKTCAMFKYVKDHKPELVTKWYDAKDIDSSWFLELANQYLAMVDGYTYRVAQIPNYDFCDSKFIEGALERLEKHLPGVYEEEVGVALEGQFKEGPKKDIRFGISGRIDVLHNGEIWEIKCVGALAKEHILQTALYMMLYKKARVGWLYNCATGELIRVSGIRDCVGLLELLIN